VDRIKKSAPGRDLVDALAKSPLRDVTIERRSVKSRVRDVHRLNHEGAEDRWKERAELVTANARKVVLEPAEKVAAVAGLTSRADVLVHGGERAKLAIRALGNVDDHVPFGHERLQTCTSDRSMPAQSSHSVQPLPPPWACGYRIIYA